MRKFMITFTHVEAVEWAKRGRFMPGANEVREVFGA